MSLETLADDLRRALGDSAVLVDADQKAPYLREWRGHFQGKAPIVVRPGSVADVVTTVKSCAAARVPIVPQGGNTGLVGGAVSSDREVVLSLDRLNRIRALDVVDGTISVDAGCTLSAVQTAASEQGLYFPLSLSAEGTCQIGGNISTNAGGVNVLRYGSAIRQILGIEVVLPDGRLLERMNTLRKNNTGYPLPQLFAGSEGTLGVITGAVLQLAAAPEARHVFWLGIAGMEQAVETFVRLRKAFPSTLAACEVISDFALGLVQKQQGTTRRPTQAPYHLLCEVHGGHAEVNADAIAEVLARWLDRGQISDAVLAQSERDCHELWSIRHAISDAQRQEGVSIKHDIAVPLSGMANFVRRVCDRVEDIMPGTRPVCFGHVGDGNLHFNLTQPVNATAEQFRSTATMLTDAVYEEVARVGGTISAEHGIGLLKKSRLREQVGGSAVDTMRAIKHALDPTSLMNPGKLL